MYGWTKEQVGNLTIVQVGSYADAMNEDPAPPRGMTKEDFMKHAGLI